MNKTCETCIFWKGDSSSYMDVCDLPTSGAARTEFNHSCSAHTMKKELIVPDSPVNQPQQQPARDYSNIRASMFPGFNIPMEVVKDSGKFLRHGYVGTSLVYDEYGDVIIFHNNRVIEWDHTARETSYTSEIKVVKYENQLYAHHEDSINPTYDEIRRHLFQEQADAIKRRTMNMLAYGNGLDYEIAYTQGDTYPRIISASLPARHHPPIESLSEPLNDTDSDDDTDTNPT